MVVRLEGTNVDQGKRILKVIRPHLILLQSKEIIVDYKNVLVDWNLNGC